jgi:threonine synthase
MDVGNPSNFIRILELFENDYNQIKTTISSYSFNDEETANTLKNVYKTSNMLLDPHTAVAFNGLQTYLKEHTNEKGIILATAHPLKFAPIVEDIIEEKINIPNHIQHIMNSPKQAAQLPATFGDFKKHLKSMFK